MQSFVLLLTLLYVSNPRAHGGPPEAMARVSFDHIRHNGSEDFRIFTLWLFSDGVVELRSGARDRRGEVIDPIVAQLDYKQFKRLEISVYLVSEAKLAMDKTNVVCKRLPPVVHSDLFLLDGYGGGHIVLSQRGCWRGIFIHPTNSKLQRRAEFLRSELLSIGNRLLQIR